MGNNKFVMGVIVLVLAICGSGYWVKASLDKSKTSLEQLVKEHSTEQALLESKLEEAQARLLAESVGMDFQKLAPLDPRFLVQRLNELEMEKDQPDKNYRAFYCLQGLADAGTNALPVIKDFFISGVDTDLELPYFSDPHTLRQEITAILCGMRTMESAALLSQLLPVTQTVTELENLCKVLLEISPETFHSHCVKAARNLYRELVPKTEKDVAVKSTTQQLSDSSDILVELREVPVESVQSTIRKLNDISRIHSLLFQTLKDIDFAYTLMEEGAWITKGPVSGKEMLNAKLFDSTRELLGEESIQWYYAAFKHMRENALNTKGVSVQVVSDGWIGYALFKGVVNSYAGINPMATEMYLTLLRGDSIPIPTQQYRYQMVSELERIYDYFASEQNHIPLADERRHGFIAGRLGLLDNIAAEYAHDDLMQEVIDVARTSLERQAYPDAELHGEMLDDARESLTTKIEEMRRKENFERLKQSLLESLDKMKKEILKKGEEYY